MPQLHGSCGTLTASKVFLLLFLNRSVQIGVVSFCCLLWGLDPSFGAPPKRPIVRKKTYSKKKIVQKKAYKAKSRRVATVAPAPVRQLTQSELLSQQDFIAAFDAAAHPEQQTKLWTAAISFLGTPYRYAGSTRQGMDCSGYTSTVYREVGVQIPRSAQQQFHFSQPIERDQLALGDLVFFGANESAISHVGLYLGEGKYSHAALTTRNVRIDTLAPMLGNIRFLGARRVPY